MSFGFFGIMALKKAIYDYKDSYDAQKSCCQLAVFQKPKEQIKAYVQNNNFDYVPAIAVYQSDSYYAADNFTGSKLWPGKERNQDHTQDVDKPEWYKHRRKPFFQKALQIIRLGVYTGHKAVSGKEEKQRSHKVSDIAKECYRSLGTHSINGYLLGYMVNYYH